MPLLTFALILSAVIPSKAAAEPPTLSLVPLATRVTFGEPIGFRIRFSPMPTEPLTINFLLAGDPAYNCTENGQLQLRVSPSDATAEGWNFWINTPQPPKAQTRNVVRLSLSPGEGYELGSPATQTVTLSTSVIDSNPGFLAGEISEKAGPLGVKGLRVSPNDSALAAYGDRFVWIYDTVTGTTKTIRTRDSYEKLEYPQYWAGPHWGLVSFSPEGRYLAYLTTHLLDGYFSVYDRETDKSYRFRVDSSIPISLGASGSLSFRIGPDLYHYPLSAFAPGNIDLTSKAKLDDRYKLKLTWPPGWYGATSRDLEYVILSVDGRFVLGADGRGKSYLFIRSENSQYTLVQTFQAGDYYAGFAQGRAWKGNNTLKVVDPPSAYDREKNDRVEETLQNVVAANLHGRRGPVIVLKNEKGGEVLVGSQGKRTELDYFGEFLHVSTDGAWGLVRSDGSARIQSFNNKQTAYWPFRDKIERTSLNLLAIGAPSGNRLFLADAQPGRPLQLWTMNNPKIVFPTGSPSNTDGWLCQLWDDKAVANLSDKLPALLNLFAHPGSDPTRTADGLRGLYLRSPAFYRMVLRAYPQVLHYFKVASGCQQWPDSKQLKSKLAGQLKNQLRNQPFSYLVDWAELALFRGLVEWTTDEKTTWVDKISHHILDAAIKDPALQGLFPSQLFQFIESRAGMLFGIAQQVKTDFALVRTNDRVNGYILANGKISIGGEDLGTKTRYGLYLARPLSLSYAQAVAAAKESMGIYWDVGQVKNFSAKVDFEKIGAADYLNALQKMKSFDLGGPKVSAMVLVGENYRDAAGSLLQSYKYFFNKELGIQFTHKEAERCADFVIQKIESGEVNVLLKEAHSGGDTRNFCSVSKSFQYEYGEKDNVSVYLVYPKKGSPAAEMISNDRLANAILKRVKTVKTPFVFLNTSCWSIHTSTLLMLSAMQSDFLNVFTTSLASGFSWDKVGADGKIAPAKSVLGVILLGVIKQKSFAQVRADINNSGDPELKLGNDRYVLPGEETYIKIFDRNDLIRYRVAVFDPKGNPIVIHTDIPLTEDSKDFYWTGCPLGPLPSCSSSPQTSDSVAGPTYPTSCPAAPPSFEGASSSPSDSGEDAASLGALSPNPADEAEGSEPPSTSIEAAPPAM